MYIMSTSCMYIRKTDDDVCVHRVHRIIIIIIHSGGLFFSLYYNIYIRFSRPPTILLTTPLEIKPYDILLLS